MNVPGCRRSLAATWILLLFIPLATAHDEDRTRWFTALEGHGPMTPALDAAGAVDGVIVCDFGFHTDREDRPWWRVDLGAIRHLHRVVIFNRTTTPERAKTVAVELSLDGTRWTEIYRHDGTLFGGHKKRRSPHRAS